MEALVQQYTKPLWAISMVALVPLVMTGWAEFRTIADLEGLGCLGLVRTVTGVLGCGSRLFICL